MDAGGAAIDPMARRLIEHCAEQPASYLAHEFMNAAWAPCFHQDVATAMAGAKLHYVGSPRLLENFPSLTLDDTARAIAAEFEDPAMVELLKDVTGNQPLRHDVFIRGAVRLDAARRDAALGAISLGLSVPYARRQLEFDAPTGRASMSEGLYQPAFERLANGPATVADLLARALRTSSAAAVDNPAELLAMLIGTGQALPIADATAIMDPACVRLNAAMFAEKMHASNVMQRVTLAVPALGGGYSLPGLAAFAVLRQHDWLSEATSGQALPQPDGTNFTAWANLVAPGGDDATIAQIISVFSTFFEQQAPMLNRLGIVC